MTPDEIWKEIWERTADGAEIFCHAKLLRDIEMDQGRYTAKSVCKAGTTVLITMASRFGDVGIRAYDIDTAEHGYSTRVWPKDLEPIRFIVPREKGWRRELEERLAKQREKK